MFYFIVYHAPLLTNVSLFSFQNFRESHFSTMPFGKIHSTDGQAILEAGWLFEYQCF